MGNVGVRFVDGDSVKLSPTLRDLLAILIAVGPEGATSEQLADELWGEVLPARWRPSLRMAVTRLRTKIGASAIEQSGGGYRLDLPIESVDLWHLGSLATDDTRSVTEADLKKVLAGDPFVGVDARAQIAYAADLARAQQAEVTLRFCVSAREMTASTGARLVGRHPGDRLDERLAVAIGRALARSGYVGQAVGYINDAIAAFQTELDFTPLELRQLEGELPELAADETLAAAPVPRAPEVGASEVGAPEVGASEVGAPEVGALPIPFALRHHLEHGCYGREQEIERLCNDRSSLLVGPSGSGKTRLLAEVSHHAVQAGEVVSYIGAAPRETPYGPFVAAFKRLHKVLVEDQVAVADSDREPTHRAAEASRWVAVQEHLDQVAGDGRHWVLIDNVQAFDSASKRMVAHLARATTQHALRLVVCGRSDQTDDEWIGMRAELKQLGFDEIDVASLGPAALGELIQSVHPKTSLQARNELALELVSRNAGLPAVARSLLDAIDPETMTLDEGIGSYDPKKWSQPALGLPPEVVAVGVAAAVVGLSFTVGEVIELLDIPEDEVTDALETLWLANRLVDGAEPDELQFNHALARDAFLREAPQFKLAALHRRAAEMTDDLHAKARHQAAAVPAVEPKVAARSLIASANQYMEAGSWRDALGRLRNADLLLDDGLDLASLITMATALEYAGMSGKRPRQRAFELAVAATRWDKALEAALSGLPAAEKSDGDPDRIVMLDRIPAEHLSPEHRFARSEALARHHALDGRSEGAARWADQAAREAATPSHVARAKIARWSTMHHVNPAGYRFDDATTASAGLDERARMAQMSAISLIEAGDYVGGIEAHRQFCRLAIELGNPVRIWQGMVFDATLAFDQGQWATSAQLVAEAMQYGTANGMPLALLCGRGQLFHAYWVRRAHHELLAGVDHDTTDYRTSSIAAASQALVLHAGGRREESVAKAMPAIREALDRPRSPAIVVLAMLAEVAAESGDRQLIGEMRDRLADFRNSLLIAGFGIANTGPVWRHFAHLADDREEREDSLRQAVTVADASGALTWRVVTRLDLWRETNDGELWQAIETLAAGTDLDVLLQ